MSSIYGRPSNLAFQYSGYSVTRANTKALVTSDSDLPVAVIYPRRLSSEIVLATAHDKVLCASIKSHMRWFDFEYRINDPDGQRLAVAFQRLFLFDTPRIAVHIGDEVFPLEWSGEPRGCRRAIASLKGNSFDILRNGQIWVSYRTANTVTKRGIRLAFFDQEGAAFDRKVALCVAYILLTTRLMI